MQTDLKYNGVLLVDKPQGMTSHDVVDRLRRVTGIRRIGHTGTLDPMAEGLLILCLGPATRAAQFLTGLPKEYSGIIKLGAFSSTYDAEGSIMAQDRPLPEGTGQIVEAMHEQRGLRTQLAPPYSAVKVRGKKLYEYARQGDEVPQKPRKVLIQSFDLLGYAEPEIRFHARVGSGTYIRSMAHDLGIRLGCGAFLAALRRESVGQFRVEEAVPLEAILQDHELVAERLLGLVDALGHLPKITVAPEHEDAVLNGRGFTSREIYACEGLPRAAEPSLVLNTLGRVLSVVTSEPLNPRLDASGQSDVPSPAVDIPGQALLFFRPLRVLGRE